ncbi:MAG: hypothetical protein LBR07_04505 [Puniceicoccales bacterium]|jgi:hypothetical protein|nr:hypothetical protein [Puniceicoccales bacterium]
MSEEDTPQSKLALTQVLRRLPPEFVETVLTHVQNEERDSFATIMAVLSGALKYRPNIWRKWPKPRQREWLRDNLRSPRFADSAQHLLQEWFFSQRVEMLNAFLDVIGIEHDSEGCIRGDIPDEFDPEKTRAGAEALLEKYPPLEVSLYLRLFQLGRKGGWQQIADLLDTDPRLALNPPPAAAA